MIKFCLFAIAVCSVQAYGYRGHEFERTRLGDAIDKTSVKFLKEAYTSAQDKNVVSSPLGVMLLSLLYKEGAGDGSRAEINTFLGDQDNKIISSYSDLSRSFSAMNPDFFTLANKIYVGKQFTLNEGFMSNARQYQSEVDAIDFTKPKQAADIINQWASEKSKGHIKSPITEDKIDRSAAAALFNVIFFQGHWHVPFSASKTEVKDFHVDSNTVVKKPTMRLLLPLFYTENKQLGARFVELPYKESGFRMVIVLPDKLDGLSSVLERAAEKGLLEDVFNLRPTGRKVNLELPKFEINNEWDLNYLLPKLGVTKIFNEPAPGIVKGNSVVVSKAFQKAFIKVDEEGATAGAFTGLTFWPQSYLMLSDGVAQYGGYAKPSKGTGSEVQLSEYYCAVVTPMSYPPRIPPSMDFKVDHPFAYLILHEDKIIFAGTCTH